MLRHIRPPPHPRVLAQRSPKKPPGADPGSSPAMVRIKSTPKRGPRTIVVPERALRMMERVMGAPRRDWSWIADSDWIRTPRYKGGRLRRRMFAKTEMIVPKELEDDL